MSYTPTWKKYEEGMRTGSAEEQVKAGEAFSAERDFQMRNDPAARRWEQSRKETVAREKPIFVKEIRKTPDDPMNKLRKFGEYGKFKPAPGYIVVQADEEQVGEIIVVRDNPSPTTGVVTSIGEPLHIPKNTIESPCKVGDHIIFKRGAGVEMEIEDTKCRFMQFSDVLGVFYE